MTIEQIEKYAKDNNIPIMQEEGINFLTNFIKKNNIVSILEIGSAIGYSAIKMANVSTNVNVMTIERDVERYRLAVSNIEDNNLSSRITILNIDALDFNTNDKFDLIFVDGAKGKYIDFFLLFEKNLKSNGYIITDNINFHGLTNMNSNEMTKNQYKIATKINLYRQFLIDNKDYETVFHNIGDGIAISKKR
ncbi:MAG: O-methyltransferase [Bacilli bacterium]|nr:O-methyltransferase [Bacilli bacterium]